ncbi:MAG: SMC-Scp complex subunit ScpB [Kiritimatiellia bacterium]
MTTDSEPVENVETAGDGANARSRRPLQPPKPRVPLPSSLQEIVGALLFASESPLTAGDLRGAIKAVAPEEGDDAEVMNVYQTCTAREIEQALRGLEKELERSGCGFRLVCAGGAYRLQTVPSCGRHVRALLKLDRPNRLSRAALETLAIIAYRQPITKAEIEQIRGVAVDTIVKTLVELQLVRLVGRSELPGHPFLYGTTPLFLEHFGLASLSELNAIDPTLQRSNPRERAKLFVKKEAPKPEPAPEDTAPAAAAPSAAAPAAAETARPVDGAPVADAGTDAGTDAGAAAPAGGADAPLAAADEPVRGAGLMDLNDDDDVFIDDTPDEFDDDDDDNDDDGDGEENGEEEGENGDGDRD